jgi:putative spermidine/putrescine transport system substrate-binding protein
MTPQTRHTHRRRRNAVITATIIAVAATAGSTGGAFATTEPVGTEPAGTEPAGTEGGETDYQWTPNEELLAGAEGAVNIVSWAGYVVDGSGNEGVDWVTPFEEITGCAVNNQLGNSSDEMVTLMQSGEYDVVSASGDATERLIAGGEVGPLDVSQMSSYEQIFEDLKLQQWNSVDGEPYGMPHGRGANLLVYNTEAFADGAPDSWSVVFEGGTPADGSLSIYDYAIYIADAALYLMATQPDLGITDPYALDQTQFDAAIALLEQQQGLGVTYWAVYTDQQAALEGGTALAGTTWQVIVNGAQAAGATVDAVKPVEGATGWSDTWMLSTKAANPNCGLLWNDWITSPWANAQVAEWFGEAPSNAESCGLTANPDHCALFHAEETEYWTDVWYWKTPTEECLDGRTDVTCVAWTAWVEAWNTLRS